MGYVSCDYAYSPTSRESSTERLSADELEKKQTFHLPHASGGHKKTYVRYVSGVSPGVKVHIGVYLCKPTAWGHTSALLAFSM
jgi:hypothetical protein